MLVSICTSNESILSTLVSLVATQGCKFKQLRKYDFQAIKGTDICLLDLDNLTEYHELIKKDINILSEIIIVGLTKSDEIKNEFSTILNVVKKPFNSKDFIYFKNKIKEDLKSDYTINKEVDIVYDCLGIKKSDLLSEENLNNDKLLKNIKKQTREAKTIKQEKDFFESIGISNISIPKQKINTIERKITNNNSVYEDKALEKYRFYKLKRLNLSKMEIDQKLQILAEEKNAIEAAKRRKENDNSRNFLLENLKNGNLANKPIKKQEEKTNIKITKENDKNIGELTAEEIYSINKKKNEEIKNQQNNNIEKTKTPINSSLNNKNEEDLLNEFKKNKQNKKTEDINNTKNTPPKNIISSPVANTTNLDSSIYKPKRIKIEDETKTENIKKSYNNLLEIEKQKEEELNKKNTISVLDLNLTPEQEEEIKAKLQNLRKYKKAETNIPKVELNDKIETENKIETNIKDKTSEEIREEIREEIKKEILKEIKEEIIKENEVKIEITEKKEIKDNISKEETLNQKKSETKNKTKQSKKEEDKDLNEKMYNAIHRLDGSSHSNKTDSSNKTNNDQIKDIKTELPSTSLFDLIKEKNKDIKIVDYKEVRKNKIKEIVKPPKR